MPPDVAKIPREGKTTISNARPRPKLPWKILKSPGNLASAPITWASRIIQVFMCVPKQRSSFAFPNILGAEVSQLPEDMRLTGWTPRMHSRGLSDTSTCFHLREPFYPNVTTVVSETISVPIPLSLLLQGGHGRNLMPNSARCDITMAECHRDVASSPTPHTQRFPNTTHTHLHQGGVGELLQQEVSLLCPSGGESEKPLQSTGTPRASLFCHGLVALLIQLKSRPRSRLYTKPLIKSPPLQVVKLPTYMSCDFAY